MIYSNARSMIRSGDVIGIATRGPLSWLVRLVQRIAGFGQMSYMAHVGMAKWVDGRLFLVEMDGVRNVMVPLSQYEGLKMYVYCCPVSELSVAETFDQVIGRFIAYGYFDLVRIGLRMVFDVNFSAPTHDKTNQVCSHFVLEWLKLAGWLPPADMPAEPSPCELCLPLMLRCVIEEDF